MTSPHLSKTELKEIAKRRRAAAAQNRDANDDLLQFGSESIRKALAGAIDTASEEQRTKSSPVTNLHAWSGRLERNGNNQVCNNMTNLMLFLTNTDRLGDRIKFNDFARVAEWNGKPITDADLTEIRLLIERTSSEVRASFIPRKGDVFDAVERLARENRYDPVRDYLESLQWDQKPRIDHWLARCMGVADTAIVRTFAAKFLIGAVARIFKPGCQMDNMLVLEGAQGAGKTSACRILFGEDYLNSNLPDFKSTDAFQALEGRWCIEVAELAALKKSDVSNAKKFISETVDRYRASYGRKVESHPRRCVFIGTTNEATYLLDPTGNRRYWPVQCGDVDLKGLANNRDQIWAEAVTRFRADEPWWLTHLDQISSAEALQSDRITEDPWSEILETWVNSPENRMDKFFATKQMLEVVLGISRDRQSKQDEMRVGACFTRLGWEADRRRAHGGEQNRGYVRPAVPTVPT